MFPWVSYSPLCSSFHFCWLRNQKGEVCVCRPGGSLEEIKPVSSESRALGTLLGCVSCVPKQCLRLEAKLVNLISIWGFHYGKIVLFSNSGLPRNVSLFLAQIHIWFNLTIPMTSVKSFLSRSHRFYSRSKMLVDLELTQHMKHVCCCLASKLCLTFGTTCTVAHKAPLFMEFPRKRLLEWAISFTRGSSQTRAQTHDSCIGRWILYCGDIRESALSIASLSSPHYYPHSIDEKTDAQRCWMTS